MDILTTFVLIVVSVIIGYIVFILLKNIVKMIIQTAISLLGLYVCFLYGILPITHGTIIVAAIGGIPGLLLLIGLSFLGIKF